MGRIFIMYRGSCNQAHAGRLHESPNRSFAADPLVNDADLARIGPEA